MKAHKFRLRSNGEEFKSDSSTEIIEKMVKNILGRPVQSVTLAIRTSVGDTFEETEFEGTPDAIYQAFKTAHHILDRDWPTESVENAVKMLDIIRKTDTEALQPKLPPQIG